MDCIDALLGRDLRGVVCAHCPVYDLAHWGQWPVCRLAQSAAQVDELLKGACAGGHTDLARHAVARNPAAWDPALDLAFLHGHRETFGVVFAQRYPKTDAARMWRNMCRQRDACHTVWAQFGIRLPKPFSVAHAVRWEHV